MIWVPITLLAALAQTFRFMFQKKLRIDTLSTGGATFTRFFYSAPLIVLVAVLYPWVREYELPITKPIFYVYAAAGGFCQVSATMCVVALFQQRNFAVGIAFKKAEVLLAVGFGLLLLGEGISLLPLAAICIGVIAVVILSDTATLQGNEGARFFNRATALGLSCGVFFGLCAVLYRASVLQVTAADVFARSSFTLAVTILIQLTGMSIYLYLREPGQIKAVAMAWKTAIWIGSLSLIGSLCWFTAFALQNAAYVKAVGQVEILMSFAISFYIFKESIQKKEVIAIALLTLSIILLILLH
jgi:drug/metabolite transporter (DMT)-like permease|tara:strand:+ start:3465 stop:4364 length:900 start_codon:yes stop_codon:yes gene_type:complete